ncbi:hypothetical protein ACJJTC_000023 [Scirpophaga incertulas]
MSRIEAIALTDDFAALAKAQESDDELKSSSLHSGAPYRDGCPHLSLDFASVREDLLAPAYILDECRPVLDDPVLECFFFFFSLPGVPLFYRTLPFLFLGPLSPFESTLSRISYSAAASLILISSGSVPERISVELSEAVLYALIIFLCKPALYLV